MGRRVAIGIVTIIMILGLTSCTWAVSTVSFNTLPGGGSENGGYDYDLNQWTLGLVVPMNHKLNFSADLTNGVVERHGASGDTFGYKLKGAYQVFSHRKINLALTGGIFHRDLELPAYADYSVGSLILGGEGQIALSRRAWLHAGLGFGLSPHETLDEYYGSNLKGDSSSLVLFNLKLNYLVNPRFGLSLGYVSESYDSHLLNQGNFHTGISAGAFLRF